MKRIFITLLLLLCVSAIQANAKKLLIVATSSDHPLNDPSDKTWGCYLTEVADFYGTAHKYGYDWDDIDIVSPLGGKVPIINVPPHMWQTQLTSAERTTMHNKLDNSLKPNQIKADDYDIIYYAGGYSCLVDFPNNTEIEKIAASIYEKGGKVGAVCDGVAGLIPITLSSGKALVDGVKVVTNEYDVQSDLLSVTDELQKKGGVISNQQGAMTDKNIVTAKNVQPVEVTERLMKLLGKFTTSVSSVNMPTMTCYPNPATTTVKVELPHSKWNAQAAVYTMTGSLVYEQKVATDGLINTSTLAIGNYTLIVENEGTTYKSVITKQ